MHDEHSSLPLDALTLWAKGNPKNREASYHPLICHLIDVGAVAARLWAECIPESAKVWFGEQIALNPDDAALWVVFWAASHDVGKSSPAFQTREKFPGTIPHGTISTLILRDLLAAAPYGIDPDVADRLAIVVGGHHGVFPSAHDLRQASRQRDQIGRGDWRSRQSWFCSELWRLFGQPEFPPARLTNAGALWLAGFISVADWIGSNSEFFPFAAPGGALALGNSLDDYLRRVGEQAEQALRVLGWSAWPSTTQPLAFRELFPFSPNDVQERLIAIADSLAHPSLIIVEAPMGEGKTEAALYVADRGNAELGMRGAYVALPTQATSNQMFQRVRDFLDRRYPDLRVNMQLLHGRASLSSDFQALKTNERTFMSALEIPIDHNLGFDGAKPGVIAAAWFTARKRGLLAPFGVGTIDQSLLAVLQTRHFFVRLLGLAGKTVIFDEVHAYDTYMSVLLERLLAWLAALGCSVVLLSATLPRARQERLLRAYSGDSRSAAFRLDEALAYPCITWRCGDTSGASSLETSNIARKRVQLKWIMSGGTDGHPDLGERLASALRGGGCAAVICNTVRSAQQTYQQLRQWFSPEELSLFHARYLYGERTARELATLRRFGKPGAGIQRPQRAVLVATQVIEQSLDLDFDLMVTELAPVDLILQRSGRLHRHERADRPAVLAECALWVLGPEENDGLPVFGRSVTYVYNEHVLLRSWLALRQRDRMLVPEDVAAMIEMVYDDTRQCPDGGPPGLAERWRATRMALEAEQDRDKATGHRVLILPPSYDEESFLNDQNSQLEENDPSIHQELQALTRLGEPTVTAICLTPEEAARLRPRAGDAPSRAAELLRRSVNLADRRIVHRLVEEAPPASWKTTALLRYCRLIELDEQGEAAIGANRLRIDPELGVVIAGSGEE